GRGAVHGVVGLGASFAERLLEIRLGRAALDAQAVRELQRKRDRLVDELDRLEQPIGEAELECLRGVEHPVLLQRVRDDELDRALHTDEARHELCAAPGGEEAEEDLGAGEVTNRGRDRSRRAVQRELDASAEASTVDRRDGWIGQRSQAGEQLVPGPGTPARLRARWG